MNAIGAATHPDDIYGSEDAQRSGYSNSMTVEVVEYNKLMHVACAVHNFLHNGGSVADLARVYGEYSALCDVGEKSKFYYGREKQVERKNKEKLAEATQGLERELTRWACCDALRKRIKAVVRAADKVTAA